MSEANDYDNTPVQVGRRAGTIPGGPGQWAGGRDARGASRSGPATRTFRLATRRTGRPGQGHDASRRARGAREGAAAVDHQGHRLSGRTRPDSADAASKRPPAGRSHRDRPGTRRGAPGQAAARGMAGAAAARPDSGRARGAEGRGADSGEAEPVLSRTEARHEPAHSESPRTEPGRTERSARPRQRMFSSLRARNFRLFAAGQVVSNTGTWMQRVAQDWLILQLTDGSGTAVGIATGLQFLPLLMFSLWGGMIADRYPKRMVLMVTQASMGCLALTLGVLAVTGVVQPWHVYLLAFGLGMATVVDNPTRQSFAIEMVGRDDLQNAIALNSAVFNLARIAGPAVAGIVIGFIGISTAFFLNAASYLTVIVSLRLMRQSELRPAERVARAKGQLREGLAYVRSRPDLLMTMVLVFFIATFGMNFQVTTALMSRVLFDTGAGKFGLASAVFAIGALIGALVAARRSKTGMRMLIWTGLAFGLLEAATGLMPSYWLFLVLLVPTGLAVISFTTLANSSVQLSVPAEMRGRVMGIYMLVFLGGAPLGSPLTGQDCAGPAWTGGTSRSRSSARSPMSGSLTCRPGSHAPPAGIMRSGCALAAAGRSRHLPRPGCFARTSTATHRLCRTCAGSPSLSPRPPGALGHRRPTRAGATGRT